MADQILTPQRLINGDKDLQTIEDFMKIKDETITTRFGDEIMTMNGLQEEVKKSGGYFKRYATLAAANADLANIPVDAVVKVTSATNGGDYEKVSAGATSLTKSPYDPVETAKLDATTKANAAEANAKAYASSNDGATRYGSSAFYEAKYYNGNGLGLASANAASTDLIPVKAGDNVSVFAKVSSSTYPAILVYNSSGTFVRAVVPSVFSTPTETITTIEADGFVRSQWMGLPLTDKDGVAKVVINEGSKRFIPSDGAASNPVIAAKAEKIEVTTKANAAEANAKAYVNSNDGATRYDSSAFYEAKYYNGNGLGLASANAASTDLIPVKAGDKVNVFTKVSSGSTVYPAILVYDSAGTFVRSVVPSVFSIPTETITIIEADGFVRSQWMGTPLTDKDGVAKVVINDGSKRFLTDALLPNAAAPLLAVKADKYQAANIDTSSIVLGSVDYYGLETASNLQARSPVFKLNAGDVVEISRPEGSAFRFGWNTSSTDIVPFHHGLFAAGTTYQFTIESGLEFVRFVFRKNPESEITEADLVLIKSQTVIKVNDKVVYTTDLVEAVGKLEARIDNEPVHAFNSNFRASSEATGGLVSFIDDDGKAEVYTVLSPLYKSLNVPFASAIVTSLIGTAGRMTLAQLKELAADTYNFETMNHTFSHANLRDITAPEIHDQIKQAKRWLRDNGFLDDGFILPYGGDNALVRKIVAQYYHSCYDFSNNNTGFLTFDNIQNALINRTDFGVSETRLADHKAIIDNISVNGGWVVITTHVLNHAYWDENSAADLTELINYIRAKGCKIVKPRDGFQVMGNLVENDSGFKIAANGKIIGAS